jgi:single-stranded-DNA-specific exonuclease
MSEPGAAAVWKIAEPDTSAAAELAAALELHPLVGQLLVNRGVRTPEEAAVFLRPDLNALHDPYTLPDTEKAVDRLARAIENKEKIFLHGDYDVDGVTSAALCLRALTTLGAEVYGFVPRRADGYDLQKYGVDKAKEWGASLILTADCGSCALEPIAYAKELGMDVVVTDHHRPGESLPDCCAIVNPYREDHPEPPFRELAGSGVAYKVMDALVARLMPQHRHHFRTGFADLVALGTVADVTPLRGENRILVTAGLKSLSTSRRKGITALLNSMDLLGRSLKADDISWRLGPRLNAAGRMEDADLAYRLLISRDTDEAEALAVQLGALAERSREEMARATTEALTEALLPENALRRVLVLARDRWGKGVVGVAAARVAEQCRRPTILLAYDSQENLYHGSARSVGDVSILSALRACEDLLHKYGGHSAAAGITIAPDKLEAFRDRIHEWAEGRVPDEPIAPTLHIDARIENAGALTFRLLEDIELLAPFGRDNEEPVFVTEGALVLRAERKGKDGNTCIMNLRLPGATAPFKAVRFRGGDWADCFSMGDSVDIAYTPKINEYQGRVSIELMLADMRVSK